MNLEATIHDDWNPGNWLKEVDIKMGQLEESTAKKIAADARTIVHVDESDKEHLKNRIEVKESKFWKGGWTVIAQAPGNYIKFYASFIELGLHKTRNMPAKPYLRPALKQNQSKFISDINSAFSGD